MNFGQRLKLLREQNTVTQDELSKHLGVGRPTIAGYETKGKQPSFELLEKIADFFDVSIDYLLGRTDVKSSSELSVEEDLDGYSISNKISKEINELSPESQEELKKLIELYKIRDMQKRNDEISDELTK